MAQKTKFSLHLFKNGTASEDALSENMRAKIADGTARELTRKPTAPDGLRAFYCETESRLPKWFATTETAFTMPSLESQSAATVVTLEVNERLFAATFGFGAQLLNDKTKVHDFGLLVAMNDLQANSLKAIHRADLVGAKTQASQSVPVTSLDALGSPRSYELIKRLSGKTKKGALLQNTTGTTGVSFSTEKDIHDLTELCEECLRLYQSDAYKRTEFAIYDQFKPVQSPAEREILGDLLVENLVSDERTFELGYPELTFQEVSYARFFGTNSREDMADISVETYLDAVGVEPDHFHIDFLHEDSVAIFSDDNVQIGRKPVFKCLVGALENEGTRYVLNEGNWYIPSAALSDGTDKYFKSKLLLPDQALPAYEIVSIKRERKKTKDKLIPQFEREEAYNQRAAKSSGYINFDQKWHKSSDGKFDKLEVCDLYDPDGLRFIHVKRPMRSPTGIAYLFTQGVKASSRWMQDDVAEQFIEIVRNSRGEAASDKLRKAENKDLTIEFAIADYVNPSGNSTIPFLSKIAFEESTRTIAQYGFKVAIRFIKLPRPEEKIEND